MNIAKRNLIKELFSFHPKYRANRVREHSVSDWKSFDEFLRQIAAETENVSQRILTIRRSEFIRNQPIRETLKIADLWIFATSFGSRSALSLIEN